MTSAAPANSHEAEYHRVLRFGTAVAMILFVGVGLYLWLRPKPATQPASQGNPPVATPAYFTDVYAYVRVASTDQLTVETTVTAPTGRRSTRQYTVHVTPETVIGQASDQENAQPESLALADIVVGDLVQVFGTDNLASLQSFTATRLIKIPQS